MKRSRIAFLITILCMAGVGCSGRDRYYTVKSVDAHAGRIYFTTDQGLFVRDDHPSNTHEQFAYAPQDAYIMRNNAEIPGLKRITFCRKHSDCILRIDLCEPNPAPTTSSIVYKQVTPSGINIEAALTSVPGLAALFLLSCIQLWLGYRMGLKGKR